jgi:hypothetical protein
MIFNCFKAEFEYLLHGKHTDATWNLNFKLDFALGLKKTAITSDKLAEACL